MNCYLSGGTSEFYKFLKELFGDGLHVYSSPAELPFLPGENQLYILLPHYDQGEKLIPEQEDSLVEKMQKLKESGARFYVENFQTQDYLRRQFTGLQMMGRERFCFQEYIQWNNELLQARDAFYYPAFMGNADGVVARLSDCIGVHSIFRQGTHAFPVLKKNGHFWTALMDFSCYDAHFRRPYGSWRCFFQAFFEELADISPEYCAKAFEKVYPDVVSLTTDNTPERAVRKALQWHKCLFRARDGKNGMAEMIRSCDLGLRRNLRTDAELLTAALFATAGKLMKSDEWLQYGIDLADFLLNRGIQRPDGLFKWFDPINTVYASDCGRDGLAIWQLWKITGQERYRTAALRLADAFLKWLHKDGLCCAYFSGDNIPHDRESNNNPVFYGEMTAFLLQLGEEQYTRAALRILDRISETFPAVAPFGFSDNFTYSRWLLMLASVQTHTERDVSDKIIPVLEFFRALQEPCGGIRETPIRLQDHAEAGIAVGDGSDSVADLLYCNNFVLNALSMLVRLPAEKCTGLPMENIREDYRKLCDFWLNSQIQSQDPKLDGGWMRAYDMQIGEYFGLNRDLDWGAYCIMAGWVMGFVPMTFLTEGTPWSIFG